MMNPRDCDDAILMAYADGALEPDEAQRVAEAENAYPEVATRIAMFRETGALLGALGAARREEPLPDDLSRRVERTLDEARHDKTVVALHQRRRGWRPAALAASVALVVGAVGGIVATLSLRAPERTAPSLALLDTPGIRDHLDHLPSGARDAAGDGEVEIISSFLADDGAFCREFEVDRAGGGTIVSVACRDGDAWTARFAVVTGLADQAGYAPASALATLDAFLNTIGAGSPLSPEEEAARLSAGD